MFFGSANAVTDRSASDSVLRVSDIEVAGNRTVSAAMVLSKVRTRVGDVFDEAAAAEDAERIAQLEAVAFAYYNKQIEDDKVRLTFVVSEKSIIREIVIVGNRKYKAKTLRNELARQAGIVKGDFLDRFLIESGKDAIAQFYRKKGFAFVRVEMDQEQLATGRAVYSIKEGPRVEVRQVKFVGNRDIKTGKLKKAVKTKKRQWFFFPRFYDEQKIADDVVRLQTAYQKKGYLDAQIDATAEFSADKRRAHITFKISEGPVYVIEQTELKGNVHFDAETLLSLLKEKVGRPYSQAQADYDVEKILACYRETGFIDVKVAHRRSFTGPGEVRSEFNIIEGPRFRIGQVNITGNLQTQDKVIRRVLDEYDFKPGNWYNADIARGDGQGELEKAVKRTAMTESATITPTGKLPNQRDAQTSITEGRTGMVMLGAGVDSSAGLIGQLVFEQRNFDIKDWPESWGEFITGQAFKGAGQRLRIALEPGTERDYYSVSFTEPYLRDRPISLDVIGSQYIRGRESYDEVRTRGYVDFEKRYRNDWRRGIGFRLENVDVDSVESDAPSQIASVSGDNLLAGVKLHIAKDSTDNRFIPTAGSILSANYEQVAGDYTFGILGGTHLWYKTVYEDLAGHKTVLATKLHAATVLGDAPPFEKFYAGGIGSIRGFDYRGVSTRSGVSNDPVGSDWIFLANAEVAVPLAEEVFSALFFVDSGTIDSGGYRAAVGTGIQILIPQWFGPVPIWASAGFGSGKKN